MELRFWNDPETGLPHIYTHGVTEEEVRQVLIRPGVDFTEGSSRKEETHAMKKQRLPKGWTEESIRELAARHDRQTEEEQAAEIEAALSAKDQTVLVVPTEWVPEIQALIARKRGAKRTKLSKAATS